MCLWKHESRGELKVWKFNNAKKEHQQIVTSHSEFTKYSSLSIAYLRYYSFTSQGLAS